MHSSSSRIAMTASVLLHCTTGSLYDYNDNEKGLGVVTWTVLLLVVGLPGKQLFQ